MTPWQRAIMSTRHHALSSPALLNQVGWSCTSVAVGTITSAAINTTGATFLSVAVSTIDEIVPAHTAITDSKGNTYTNLTLAGDNNLSNSVIWYCASPIVGAGHTFSFTLTGGAFRTAIAAAFSNMNNATPFDVQNGAFNDGAVVTSIQPGSITPSVNNELIICALSELSTTVPTIDSGMTVALDMSLIVGTQTGCSLAYKAQSSAAAINPTWTMTSNTAASAIASFKSA